jgi:response regulator RpfG family c-di-GMP phosphodiesterase
MGKKKEGPHTILFVDDEEKILAAITRIFAGHGYELVFASSGTEGLDRLRTHRVSVIVSDLRMPGMDGIQFLAAAAEISPDSVRLVLSAFTDLDTVMAAINTGHVWRYITKPWEDNDLVMSVKNAVGVHERDTKIKRLLEQLEEKNTEIAEINSRYEEKAKDMKKRYTKMRWKKKG